jgi:Phage derived protein Gp49-like (DUF891)
VPLGLGAGSPAERISPSSASPAHVSQDAGLGPTISVARRALTPDTRYHRWYGLGAGWNSNPRSGTGWKGQLGEPYTRQLSGKLRELRFYCGGERIRISYWIASGRRIIALTVFAKTKMRETAEIARAAAAMARCQQEGRHSADDEEG